MSHILDEIDSNERKVGSGYISGMLSIFLGAAGLGAVFCLLYPQWLTVADTRGLYNLGLIRAVIHVVLLGAFAAGIVSTALRRNKVLGFIGMALVMIAALLGGSRATSRLAGESDVYFGLDFFLLQLLLLGLVFIPIERFFRKNDQPILRGEWREDLFYFFISSLFVQSLSYLSLAPALNMTDASARWDWVISVRSAISSQPAVLQFVEIMFFTDLVQYWFHRAFHEIPWLWKFHAVHHSAKHMDWIAGSRMHLFEIILLRAFTTLPMYLLGFAESALYAYIFFVYLLSVFVHANIRFSFGFLQYIIATPRFHHWHHGIEREAINVNYAVHFPILDRLFGSYHFPQEWPSGYGIKNHPVPQGYWNQFLYPFQSAPKKLKNDNDDSSVRD